MTNLPVIAFRPRWLPLMVAAVLAGCTYQNPEDGRVATATTRARPTTTSSTTTTTTTPLAPGASPAAPPPPGLGQGASGPEVLALEQRLAELRFDVGQVDGAFDATTQHAVMAFQKFHGLPRTGRFTDDVRAALPTATLAGAMLAEGGADRVEIDLKRQVLLLFQRGELARVLSVSTGNGKRYCVEGQCARAVTPGGSFRVTRKINGLRVSRLGKLYNPLYFNGGIAIHGSPSVPGSPASHGCVRIPMSASKWFYDAVAIGTPVYVLNGSRAPVPFNEQAPPVEDTNAAAPAPVPAVPVEPATTTTAPAPPALLPVAPPPTIPPVPLLPPPG